MIVQRYAQILGVVLILVGIVGLLVGDRVWLGILNVDIFEDIVHLITGGILAYVGFGRADLELARNVIGGLGVIYLLVGNLCFILCLIFWIFGYYLIIYKITYFIIVFKFFFTIFFDLSLILFFYNYLL